MLNKIHLILGAAIVLTACKTTDVPEAQPIEIEVEPVRTCTPISAVQKVVIPAETETFIAITQIDNPPYEPIERRETQVRVIKEAQVTYVDSEGKEVLDVCADDIAAAEAAEEAAQETTPETTPETGG